MSEQTQPQAPGGDIQFGDHASIAGDVFTGGKIVKNYFLEEKKRSEVQVDLLHKMQQGWITGLREHALRKTQPIPLAKELNFKLIDRPKDLVMAYPHPQSRILSSDTKMIDIFNFEEVGHALLILGEPGSGKTIAMLELANAAIEIAEKDTSKQIPVIANLSSWTNPQQPIEDWLANDVKANLRIKRDVILSLLKENALFVFLDGLDEVREELQQACVNAINEFYATYPVPIVVCCRTSEYSVLPGKLKFGGAIEMHPPTLEDLYAYLDQVGPKLSALRAAIQQEAVLQELAMVPLTFNIMCAAYEGVQVDELLNAQMSAPLQEQRNHLFDIYVERMFRERTFRSYDEEPDETSSSEDKHKKPPYSQKHTLKWLGWLASTMLQQNQSTFLLEQLQRNWLPSRGLRILYLISIGLIFMLPVSLLIGTITARQEAIPAWDGLWVDIPIFIVATLVALRKIKPVEALRWSWIGYRKSALWLMPGFLLLFFAGFMCTLILNISNGLQNLPYAALLLAPLGILMLIIAGMGKYQVAEKTYPNQGIVQSAKNAGIIGVHVLMCTVLLLALDSVIYLQYDVFSTLLFALFFGIPLGILAALFFGGFACIQHYMLRLILRIFGFAPLRYRHFLDQAAKQVFLYKKGAGYVFIHKLFQEYMATRQD